MMRLTILLTVASALLTGCATRAYDVAIINATKNRISNASVNYGAFKSEGGLMDPGSISHNLDLRMPIPEKAAVVWMTLDNKQHEQIVEVSRVVPKSFTGKLFFKIKEDGTVDVIPIPEDDYYYKGKKP